MATTVGKLIELLSPYSKDKIITNEQNQDFIHIVNLRNGEVILSTKKPIGYCSRTGGYAYPSIVDGYTGYSPELDEDLYDFEIIPFKEGDNHFDNPNKIK